MALSLSRITTCKKHGAAPSGTGGLLRLRHSTGIAPALHVCRTATCTQLGERTAGQAQKPAAQHHTSPKP